MSKKTVSFQEFPNEASNKDDLKQRPKLGFRKSSATIEISSLDELVKAASTYLYSNGINEEDEENKLISHNSRKADSKDEIKFSEEDEFDYGDDFPKYECKTRETYAEFYLKTKRSGSLAISSSNYEYYQISGI